MDEPQLRWYDTGLLQHSSGSAGHTAVLVLPSVAIGPAVAGKLRARMVRAEAMEQYNLGAGCVLRRKCWQDEDVTTILAG
jgi:hypothetical protein